MEIEVICISSEDESDESQKENKTDKFLTNSTEISIIYGKTETSFKNNNEKIEENSLKRKKLEINEDEIISNNMEKRKKLNFDEDTSKMKPLPNLSSVYVPEICPVKSDCNTQPNKNQDVIEKVGLIVKEKKQISYISQDVFPLFISLCLQKCPKHDKVDMDKIIDKLKRRYENLDPTYARSEDFVMFINKKREAITSNSKKMYLHIEEVMNEMKKKNKKKVRILQSNEIYDAVPSTSYATSNVLPVNNGVESNDVDNDDDDEEDASLKTRRKTKQVLSAMKKCEAMIKKLEEEEVDFDDENNSNYIKVERYKRRMIELYNKLCELTGENADAGRVYLRPKHLNVTRIVAVDQAITNFINSKIIQRNQLKRTGALTDDLIFPDYRDILECVNRCNDRKNLGLDEKRRKQMAEKAFKELGEHLQRIRRNDYWDTFSLYLENAEDPAVKDENLARKLANNRTENEKRLAAVFEKYVRKQMEIKNQNNENDINNEESISEEEEDEDEEEEEEEESIIDDEDKNEENLSMTSENSDNEANINDTVKKNNLTIKNNKPNINKVNVYHVADKIISNKTYTLQEKCKKTIEVKDLKKNDTAVLTNENKTISEKTTYKPCNNNTMNIVKNIMDTKTQEDSSVGSTINCTMNLAEMETIELSEVISDPATKKITKNVIDPLRLTPGTKKIVKDVVDPLRSTGFTTELITGNVAKLITENTAELITGDIAELITEDKTETIMENTEKLITDETEIITESIDGTIENMPNNEQLEEKKKPVLRLRSFAKPPMTWEDSQHKVDKTAQETAPKVANQVKEIIDLTNEGTAKSSEQPSVITKCAIQLGKVVPILKHQTLVIPANRNVISVQNITNNYLRVNTRTGQIAGPVRGDIRGSTIIRLPSVQSTSRQSQLQNANAVKNANPAVSLKGNETIFHIIPKKSIIIKKPTVQSVSKETDVSSSTSKSK